MNKYLKILALSSGLMGAIAPSAMNIKSDVQKGLDKMYESIGKMDTLNQRASRLNYKFDINPSTDPDVKFVTTNDEGEQTDLSQTETLNYLNSTLEQTNAEYEALKQTLMNAIKDTMDYLEECKNCETELSNEQKLYIKEHSNTIKFLAETLEDLSEDVICTIDGCEDTEDFDKVAGVYMLTINNLEERIEALQHSLNSLQMINGITSPYYYNAYPYVPNNVVHGLRFGRRPLLEPQIPELNTEQEQNSNEINDVEDEYNTAEDLDNDMVAENDLNDDASTNNENQLDGVQEVENNNEDPVNQENEENNTNLQVEDNEEKPTTFGLKSNIDTYAPTKRNIDTFFNTALLDNQYNMYGAPNMYGYGYGMPYGNAGGFGYGNMYGYGMPYGNGLNSNAINREVIENQQNVPTSTNNVNTIANIENETPNQEVQKPKKIRAKKAKNVDTYKGVTVQSNINTMGESKISKFFKEKFNNLRNKVKKQKDSVVENKQDVQDLNDKIYNEPVTQQTQIEDTEALANDTQNANLKSQNNDNLNNKNVDLNNDNTTTLNNVQLNSEGENNIPSLDNSTIANEVEKPIIEQEKQIKAR